MTNPSITLLIPMYNEEKYIGLCLSSLLKQDYPKEKFEVIIFDGGSLDHSREIVKKNIANYPQVHLKHNPKKIQAAAWNLGLSCAKGQIIGIVSAHSVLAPDYVSNIIETLIRTGADMVGGPTVAHAEGLIAQTIALALNSPFGVGNARFHYTNKEIEVDSVFMGACWRKTYEKIGGFDEELVRNQDDEFSYRLRKAGGKIICNPKIQSRYYSRSSISGLWRQYFQYGLYKVRVLQKHPLQMSVRQFVPPLFVLSLLVSIILTITVNWGWILLASILGSYLIANLAVSLNTAIKRGLSYLPLLPLTFATIHTSYGLGFLAGLIKFYNRWGDKSGQVPSITKIE